LVGYGVPMRIFVLILFIALPALAHAWQGKAIHVADGDTITVLKADNRQVKIRLFGIDAPESKQDFCARAKDALAAMVGNRLVDIQEMDVDRYGRIVGLVTPDGQQTSANEIMVAQGLAWVYPQYCTIQICERWRQLEAQARAGKVGLWRQPATPPWEWRRDRRKK